MGELTKLPNIGSTVERQLEQAGIGTAEALRQLAGGAGSCRHAGDGGIPFRCTAHRSVTACYPAMPPKPFSSSMKAAPHALRGGPFASIIHSAFFLGSTAQMSCAESNAFFVSCKQQMAEMLPGRMPAAQAFPAGRHG